LAVRLAISLLILVIAVLLWLGFIEVWSHAAGRAIPAMGASSAETA
jgi:hypothetical protein